MDRINRIRNFFPVHPVHPVNSFSSHFKKRLFGMNSINLPGSAVYAYNEGVGATKDTPVT
jgi:hypothetical protein